jgi:hypothetical protein
MDYPLRAMGLAAALLGAALAAPAWGQDAAPPPADSDAELAKKLSNPVANLISVPFQGNYDCCFGPEEGERYTLNIQPVIPFELNADWSLIVRTILPVIHQGRTSPASGAASGLGDVTQSFFFSPHATPGGITWAVGPALLWPTGESELGAKKWGAGPTMLALKQDRGWTVGVLVNHIWSYADLGDNRRADVSSTFVQPFVTWTNSQHTTVSLNTESTYNWQTESWTIPVNMGVNHFYAFGKQRVQLSAGVRIYATHDDPTPNGGPNWGLRFGATFLFPEGGR